MSVFSLLTEKQTFFDANSNELTGGLLFVYLAGTTTKATSYTETDGVTPNSNPIVLNSRGEVPSGLYVAGGATYKLVLAPATDTDPPTSPIWTRDNLTPTNDIAAASGASQWVTSTYTVSYSNATTFTVNGDVTAVYQVNRRVRATIGSGNLYGTIETSSHSLGVTTVTVLWDSGSMDASLAAVDYALLSGTDPSVPVPVTQRVRTSVVIGATGNQTTITGTQDTRFSNTTTFPQTSWVNTTNDASWGSSSFYKNRAGGNTSLNDVFWVDYYGGFASAAQRVSVQIVALQDGAISGSTVPGAWVLYTQAAGGSLNENLRIDSTGCVRLAGEAAATGYTSRGDVTLPAARNVRAKNTLKAWVVFDGTPAGPTLTPLAAFNVTNITKNATGDYTLNFTNAMANINYCVVGMAGDTASGNIRSISGPRSATPTTTAFRFTVADGGPVLRDAPYIYLMVAGD